MLSAQMLGEGSSAGTRHAHFSLVTWCLEHPPLHSLRQQLWGALLPQGLMQSWADCSYPSSWAAFPLATAGSATM